MQIANCKLQATEAPQDIALQNAACKGYKPLIRFQVLARQAQA
jgi:hypothetical protein